MDELQEKVERGLKAKMAFALPQAAVDYIDQIAALSGERNRSAALRRIIREHARYESLKEQGRLRVKAE